MGVPLRRRGLGGVARHRVRAWRHDHGRSGMARRDFGVDVVAVVGAVAGDGRHCPIDPVEQGTDLGAVVGILVGQHRGDDPAGVGVGRKMQHSPGPTPLGAVLLDKPLACATELQPRAVHQQVHRPAAEARPRLWELQCRGTAAQGRVVRHGEIEIEQLEDGADQPLGLAQRQAEHRPQGQCRGDRQIGVGGLPAPGGARRCRPGRDCFRREPDGQAAASTQGGVILGPVGHPVLLLGDVMAPSGIRFERQEGCPCMVKEPRPGPILPYPMPTKRAIDATRWQKSKPLIDALKSWLEEMLRQVPSGSSIVQAIRYGFNQWDGLLRFLDDGRIEIDSNTVERSMRSVALNRKNALFAGSDEGAENWAMLASLIETCKLHGVNPEAYVTDVLTKLVNNWPNRRLGDLLPWAWTPEAP